MRQPFEGPTTQSLSLVGQGNKHEPLDVSKMVELGSIFFWIDFQVQSELELVIISLDIPMSSRFSWNLKINPKEVGTKMKTKTPPPYAHGRAKDFQKKILAHRTHKLELKLRFVRNPLGGILVNMP